MCHVISSIVLIIFLGIITSFVFRAYLMTSLSDLTDQSKCPYCYGKEFCKEVNDVSLDNGFFGKILNLFNAKNVYYGDLNNIDVVIKKLASNDELKHFDSALCSVFTNSEDCDLNLVTDNRNYEEIVLEILKYRNTTHSFQVCTPETGQDLFGDILKLRKNVDYNEYLTNVWTTLEINVEPLILQLLKSEDNWPFPKYYGSCGRIIVEEHRGKTLYEQDTLEWMDRAYLAVQLLYAAQNLTDNHSKYRFYLTDISSDNIAVDDNLQLTFVDLENLIIQKKFQSGLDEVHKSENIHDSDGFAFSTQDICQHERSDHNIYAICYLILSKQAPYPMSKYGLLVSPPRYILIHYPQLFDLIEECVTPKVKNRFYIAEEILYYLNEILRNSKISTS
ncbi:divergent protein kinase domain 2A [Onthophagus taurus]|uniref:divergent protein kinase domain 2A n=1 Tax=Onthophagus taurus TaxID=166361 RepID=UPI0039BDEC9C